jgi:hypothetical protein
LITQRVRWDQVVESDKIQNPATKTWHEVTTTVLSMDGSLVKVWIKGQAMALKPRPAAGTVEVQRGATGAVVDLFQVIFSGQTASEH